MEPMDKKLQKTGTLSSTILDYYYKFGQNRDLEKYLQLRRNCRSTSEGSLNLSPEETQKKAPEAIVENQTVDTVEKSGKNSSADREKLEVDNKEIQVKSKASVGGKAKSYSFSCESNIAISLPLAEPQLPVDMNLTDTIAESSQTDFDVTKESLVQSGKEDAAKSNKRLEWDSLGDVGYNKPSSDSAQQNVAVSSLERSVLKNFFGNRGINISFAERGKNTILPEIPEDAIPSKDSPKPKEKWRQTLESVKKKYDKQLLDNTSSRLGALRFNDLSLNRHSTPKTDRPEKCLQTSIVQTACKEVQVDLTNESSSVAVLDMTAHSSFEFIPGRSDEKENIAPNTNSGRDESCVDRIKKSQLPSTTSMSTASESANNELELGIKLLCSLIESKNLTENKKKALARKIVSRIAKRNMKNGSTSHRASNSKLLTSNSVGSSSSSRAREINMSGVKAFSSRSSTVDNQRARKASTQSDDTVERVKSSSNDYAKSSTTLLSSPKVTESKSDSVSTKLRDSSSEVDRVTANQNETMRMWLDPLTQSELNYNKKKIREKEVVLIERKATGDFVPKEVRRLDIQDREVVPKVVMIDQRAGGDFVPTGLRRPSQILDFITNERKSHLNWIQTEIEHLENLKELLLSHTNDKSLTRFKPTYRTEIVFPAFTQQSSSDNLYDKVATSSDTMATDKGLPARYQETEVVSEQEIVNIGQRYRRTVARHENEVLYDTVAECEPVQRRLKTTSLEIQEEKRFPKRNYLSDDGGGGGTKHRSKLETPKTTGPDESVTTFARNRKERFLQQYKIPQQLTTDYDDTEKTSREEIDHYSEPREPTTSKKNRLQKNDVYTTATSSDFFVSSGSISVPVGTSSSTTTTTHQYDNRIAIGIQTTESVLQTRPIYGPKHGCGCSNPCGCCCPRPTIRTYRFGRDKQTQVNPKSEAYIIIFDNGNPKVSLHSVSSDRLTLRDHLETHRPEFTQHTNQRSAILKKLHALRQERDKNVREIIENTSITSIPRKLNALPPPPTKHTRIFATKEMKAMTRRKYSQLPEVVNRVERMKIDKRKKTNKIMADVFNKKIQRRVHKGKLTLEHSMTVI